MRDARDLPLWRRWKKAGVCVVAAVVPLLYVVYMRLVWRTSRIETSGFDEMVARVRAGARIMLGVLHQDIFLGVTVLRHLDVITVASVGDAGDIITAVIERCGFEVVRGGSSTRASRRTPLVDEFVRHIRDRGERAGVLCGITPDGSRGPAGAVRPGLVVIAMHTGSDIYGMHVHATRAVYAPTWDRMAIPLPFCTIRVAVEGPFTVRAQADDAEIETTRRGVETALHTMHARTFALDGRDPIPVLQSLEGDADI